MKKAKISTVLFAVLVSSYVTPIVSAAEQANNLDETGVGTTTTTTEEEVEVTEAEVPVVAPTTPIEVEAVAEEEVTEEKKTREVAATRDLGLEVQKTVVKKEVSLLLQQGKITQAQHNLLNEQIDRASSTEELAALQVEIKVVVELNIAKDKAIAKINGLEHLAESEKERIIADIENSPGVKEVEKIIKEVEEAKQKLDDIVATAKADIQKLKDFEVLAEADAVAAIKAIDEAIADTEKSVEQKIQAIETALKDAREKAIDNAKAKVEEEVNRLIEAGAILEEDGERIKNEVATILEDDARTIEERYKAVQDYFQNEVEKAEEAAKNDAKEVIGGLVELGLLAEQDAQDFIKRIEELPSAVENGIESVITGIDDIFKDVVDTAVENAKEELGKLEDVGVEIEDAIKEIDETVKDDVLSAAEKLEQIKNAVQNTVDTAIEDALNDAKAEVDKLVEAGLLLEADATDIIKDIEEGIQDAEMSTVEKINTIKQKIAEAEEAAIDQAKQDAKDEIDKLIDLGHLAEDVGQELKDRIDAVEAGAEKDLADIKNEIDAIVHEALEDVKKGAIDELDKLLEAGEIVQEDYDKFVAAIEEAVRVDVINKVVADAKEVASILEQGKKDALAKLEELHDLGVIIDEDYEKFKAEIEAAVRIEVVNKVVEAIEDIENALADAKADAKDFLNHLKELGLIAEEDFEQAIKDIEEAVQVVVIDGIVAEAHKAALAIHKDEAIVEITGLEVEGKLSKTSADDYINQVKAATTVDEVTDILDAARAEAEDHVNTKKLEKLVENSQGKKQSDYTATTWAVFATALKDAEATLANSDATQAEVDAAYTNLNNAIKGLELFVPVTKLNTATLDKLVTMGQALKAETYTADSWANFQSVLKEAEAMQEQIALQENGNGRVRAKIEQGDVNDMALKLDKAMGKLVPAKTSSTSTGGSSSTGGTSSKPSTGSSSSPSTSSTTAATSSSSLPKTGEFTTSLNAVGAIAAAMAGYFFIARRKKEWEL